MSVKKTSISPREISSQRAVTLGVAPVACLAFLVGAPTAAHAQTRADTADEIGEVVVTAQRRSESIQRAALAVSVLTGDALESQGVTTARDLQVQIPALQISPQIFGNLQVWLRGIGSSNNQVGGDPAIAFHMDGAYVSRTTSIGGLLYDIERIEVVKGPQGTLYGRNATGGSVNVITRKPTFDFNGAGSLEFGNYNALHAGGHINVPLADTLALRVAFQSARHDGYLKAEDGVIGYVGNDRQDQDDISGRAHLLYRPTDRFSLLLTGDYTHQGGAGAGDQRRPALTGNNRLIRALQNVSNNNRFTNGQLEMNYEFNFAELTYVGARRNSVIDRVYEYPVNNFPSSYETANTTYSNELRLSGDTNLLKWVVGYYGFSEKTESHHNLRIPPASFRVTRTPAEGDANAFFAQGTYAIVPSFRITAGARWTEDKKKFPGMTSQDLDASGNLVRGPVTNAYAEKEWTSTDWKAGAELDVAPDVMAYANVGTAYKSGGFDSKLYSAGSPDAFEPEDLRSYEIGVKSRLVDRKLLLNVALYQYDYKNFQVGAIQLIGGAPTSYTMNAGKAVVKGLELESGYVSDGWGRVDGSLAYVDARYRDFYLPFGDSWTNYGKPAPEPFSFEGRRMPITPEWSANLSYEYGWPLTGGAALKARIQTHYESAKYMEVHQFEPTYQKAYTKTDISFTYSSNADRWSLEGYVRNIENRDVLTSAIPPFGGSPAVAQVFYAAPRLYGVRATARF